MARHISRRCASHLKAPEHQPLSNSHAAGISTLTGTRKRASQRIPPTSRRAKPYGEQVIPVGEPVHEMVGNVQPELVNAVNARTRPTTTLHFKRDMNHSIR
ncbi:hypothetical protein KXD96_02065 [Mycobacterium sp. SMC-2]|uniref:hypothetical protein n=1 Tax=Mycobacterium sp. SMC-2 TaxID=2857058 RepID=UPI0021B40A0C|nr:hypothetical protein [Mycobacterium sp. SMC-2]UXA06977.1 hypothetical protein KXD96_02065 [Mycobacterium sp. SMC-2]